MSRPFGQFLEFLRQQGLDAESRVEDDLYEIYLPEDLDEELSESIEKFYDEILDLNRQLFDRELAADSDYHAAGVVVNLAAGQTVYANVRPVSAVFLVLQRFGSDFVVKMGNLRHQLFVFREWVDCHHALYF